MKYSSKEHSEITKSVLEQATIESSSDFIEVLYEILKHIDPESIPNLSPIRELEYENWRLGDENILDIEQKLKKLEFADLVDAEMAYKYVIEQFLDSETISKKFKLDNNDSTGWAILHELNSKRDYCKRLFAIFKFKETNK